MTRDHADTVTIDDLKQGWMVTITLNGHIGHEHYFPDASIKSFCGVSDAPKYKGDINYYQRSKVPKRSENACKKCLRILKLKEGEQ